MEEIVVYNITQDALVPADPSSGSSPPETPNTASFLLRFTTDGTGGNVNPGDSLQVSLNGSVFVHLFGLAKGYWYSAAETFTST